MNLVVVALLNSIQAQLNAVRAYLIEDEMKAAYAAPEPALDPDAPCLHPDAKDMPTLGITAYALCPTCQEVIERDG